MSILINIASEFTGAKAFKKAEKATFNLDKSVKKLGKSLGVTLSVTAVAAFGKAAMKAFAEDEAGAARLAKTVDNLGLSFANTKLATFIEDLSATSGVVDDQLRPALQALLTTTGSLTGSQELLTQAIDISRGSGVALTEVAQDLANAYVGNTKGLKKYNLGLTQAELKTASFTTIQEKLNAQFGGSNAAYLATYAGQMQLLTTAAGEAKETIGGGLIDAFKIIAGDTTITDLTQKIQKLATNIADFFRGLAKGFKDLSEMPVIKQLIQLAKIMLKILGAAAGAVVDPFTKEGARQRSAALAPSSANAHLAGLTAGSNAAKAAKAEKDAAARAKAIAAAQNKNTAELKKQALAKKQSALFDMEQIQIIAALKGKISEEDKLRLNLQLALLTGNEAQAKKLSDQLADSIDKTGKLKQYINTLPEAPNPFAAWDTFLDGVIAKARLAASIGGSGSGGGAGIPPQTNVPPQGSIPPQTGSDAWAKGQSWWREGGFGATSAPVVVQIDGKTIASALMDQSLSGNQAYVNRRTGGFE